MYYVYIITNQHNTTLYTGITNSLEQRVFDHKAKRNKGFAYRYNCEKLVYYEEFVQVIDAIAREKQLKKYHRVWKEELIRKMNPEWKDLSEGWYSLEELEAARKLYKEQSSSSTKLSLRPGKKANEG
jgi:putative endonuclease